MNDPSQQADGDAQQAEATFAAARQILAAPRSPADVGHGISLLEEASGAGSAAATEVRALFQAMGIAGPPSWDNAFDLLQLSAEQGSTSARRQLAILADPSASWDSFDPSADQDWSALRARISVERLIAVNDRIALSEDPRIRVIEKFASEAECRWLIERARPRLVRATVLKKTGDHGVAQGRSNSGTAFQVIEMDVLLEMIRNRISSATRVPVPLFEPTQVLHYSVGQEFRPHHDYLDPANPAYTTQLIAGQRIATFLIYLNSEFAGGETEFPAVGVRFRGQTGDAIFWANLDRQNQPDPLTIHAGLPPTSGEKWILSQWIRDRAGVPAGNDSQ